MVLPLLLASVAGAPVRAAELSAGAGVELRAVVDDAAQRDPPAVWGPMPTLVARGRLALEPLPVALRADLSLSHSAGETRVSLDGADAILVPTRQTGVGLLVGPELGVPLPGASLVSPYVLVNAGGIVVRDRVALSELTGIDAGDDAVSRALRPAFGLGLGVTAHFGKILAVDVEAGYTVCDVPAAALPRQGDEPPALRTGYGLNQFRIGVSLRLATASAVAPETAETTLRAAEATEEAAP